MADLKLRKRRRLRDKEVRKLAEELEDLFGSQTLEPAMKLDRAEADGFDVILEDNVPLVLIRDDRPFLTLKGLLRYAPQTRWITVDMGAVKFVCNGADIMLPGIVAADDAIREGDFVWIRDETNKKPLAVGIALVDTDALREKREKGKAIRSIHYIGDALWKYEK